MLKLIAALTEQSAYLSDLLSGLRVSTPSSDTPDMQNTTQDRDPQPTEVNMQDPLDQLELIQRIKELIINDAQALYGPQVTGHTYSVIFSVEALPESQSSDGQPKRQSLTAQLILYVSPHPPARWVLLATSESKGSLVEAVDNLRINVQVEVGKVTRELDGPPLSSLRNRN